MDPKTWYQSADVINKLPSLFQAIFDLADELDEIFISTGEEQKALIRILRDETSSKEIYDRCVAIVGNKD